MTGPSTSTLPKRKHELPALPNKAAGESWATGMSDVDQPERATQDRVIALFRDELGYRYIGDRADRCDNSNIEEHQLSAWLTKFGYTSAQIKRGSPQTPHRSRQPQPRALRQQPGCL